MKIIYGTETTNIDITNFCINKLMENNKITIPSSDKARCLLFSDPSPNMEKKIFVQNNNEGQFFYCDNNKEINIYFKDSNDVLNLHKKLKINHGSFKEELPEQRLVYMFLKGDEKVLEIGGNIGRNSMIISSILNDSKNLLVLESNSEISKLLIENKELNNLNFNIEAKALSKNKLIQRGWNTKESDILEPEYKWVEICDYNYLKDKYQLIFDTLVVDCEGAFYFIVRDFPEILENVNLIIMENDYVNHDNYNYVIDKLKNNGFNCVYMEYLAEASWSPCMRNFFEVWKKSNNDNSIEIYTSQHL
jgi:FkbM family methyltransferase